jgi:hypothetical protein
LRPAFRQARTGLGLCRARSDPNSNFRFEFGAHRTHTSEPQKMCSTVLVGLHRLRFLSPPRCLDRVSPRTPSSVRKVPGRGTPQEYPGPPGCRQRASADFGARSDGHEVTFDAVYPEDFAALAPPSPPQMGGFRGRPRMVGFSGE